MLETGNIHEGTLMSNHKTTGAVSINKISTGSIDLQQPKVRYIQPTTPAPPTPRSTLDYRPYHPAPPVLLHSPPSSPPTYPFLVIFFPCFRFPFSLSLSKNLLCSSAPIPFNFPSLTSFLRLSPSSRLSSAFSSSSTLRSFALSESRVARILRSTSGRKCAAVASWSGRRRK